MPFSALGLFFWLQFKIVNLDWESQHDILALQVWPVPGGTIDHDLHFTVALKSDVCDYDVRKKVQFKMLPRELPNAKNCVFIPALAINDGEGVLRINIVKTRDNATHKLDLFSKPTFDEFSDWFVALKNHFAEITGTEVMVIVILIFSMCCILVESNSF